jgi:uncharacterized integral membrane protein
MDTQDQEEQAPVFRKWSTWYALVIGFLLLMILLFYFLTKHYS